MLTHVLESKCQRSCRGINPAVCDEKTKISTHRLIRIIMPSGVRTVSRVLFRSEFHWPTHSNLRSAYGPAVCSLPILTDATTIATRVTPVTTGISTAVAESGIAAAIAESSISAAAVAESAIGRGVLIDKGVCALGLVVTHLLAVGALDAGDVPRLRAFLAEMTHLIAVAALNVGHVLRFGALLGDVAFLAAVAAAVASSLGTILREVAHLVSPCGFSFANLGFGAPGWSNQYCASRSSFIFGPLLVVFGLGERNSSRRCLGRHSALVLAGTGN